MDLIVWLVAAAMAGFAVISAIREVRLYRMALKGDELYLISQRRRNRRLVISVLLVTEAAFLLIGVFFFVSKKPYQELLFWTLPLLLIALLIHLTLQDFRETSRDIDRIFKEARKSALEIVGKDKRA